MTRIAVPAKRSATIYGYITVKNRKWLIQQSKKHGLKLSPMLDLFLDKLRDKYPLDTPKKKSA
jgi:hypothetical protein